MIPAVPDELEGVVRREDVVILVATGRHRGNEESELGGDVWRRDRRRGTDRQCVARLCVAGILRTAVFAASTRGSAGGIGTRAAPIVGLRALRPAAPDVPRRPVLSAAEGVQLVAAPSAPPDRPELGTV
ncbi:hypothetical protein [Streptomyces sp. NPDC056628]|uniref:hypothetical protein n=1 Tax=Streptomyces sp. NPDC056628 TaxID=3345882 RepID=UPI00368A496E